ncbi:uncharacterized protein F5147DRAFT_662391, partial [Suillus discolor]
MHFSFAIFLIVVAQMASSSSATPIQGENPASNDCPVFCARKRQCHFCEGKNCVSYSGLCPGFNHDSSTRQLLICIVSSVSAFSTGAVWFM